MVFSEEFLHLSAIRIKCYRETYYCNMFLQHQTCQSCLRALCGDAYFLLILKLIKLCIKSTILLYF